MAINPEDINLVDIKGLSQAFNPNLEWFLATQSPDGNIVNSIKLSVIAQMIAGDIILPDGVLTGLDVTFNNGTNPKTGSVSSGQWRIDNTVYQINVPYVSNINVASSTDRTDAFIADNSGDVFYQPNFNGTLASGQVLVIQFTVPADGGDIEVGPTPTVHYAVMNSLNDGDLNITGQFMINGVPFSGGGSIDDDVISLLSTWSSQKINDVFAKKPDSANGVVIDVSDIANGNIEVSADDWTIDTVNYIPDVSPELFTGVSLSDTGKQRYIAFYGNTDNEIIKVEGVESEAAVMPDAPADSVQLGYTLVTDDAAENPIIDDSNFAKLSGGNVFNGIQEIVGAILRLSNTPIYTNNSIDVFARGSDVTDFNNLRFGIKSATGDSEKYSIWIYPTGGGQVAMLTVDRTTQEVSSPKFKADRLGAGTTPNSNAKLTIATGSTTETQIWMPSRSDANAYTGNLPGLNNIDNIPTWRDQTANTPIIKKDRNPSLASSNALSVVGATADGSMTVAGGSVPATVADTDIINAIKGATFDIYGFATISVSGKTLYAGQEYRDTVKNICYEAYADNLVQIVSKDVYVDRTTGELVRMYVDSGTIMTEVIT